MKRLASFLVIVVGLYAQSPVNSVASGCALEFGPATTVEISPPNNANFDGFTEFTAELWIKTSTLTGNWDAHFSMWKTGGPYSWWAGFQSTTGELELWVSGDGTSVCYYSVNASDVVDNKWHHIAYVKGTNYMKIYVDGIERTGNYNTGSNCTPLSIADINHRFFIGYDAAAGAWDLNGQIDEVRIWNYARSQAEIRRDMCRRLTGNEPGLVGYWRFDECSGNIAYDASGNGNNGTLY